HLARDGLAARGRLGLAGERVARARGGRAAVGDGAVLALGAAALVRALGERGDADGELVPVLRVDADLLLGPAEAVRAVGEHAARLHVDRVEVEHLIGEEVVGDERERVRERAGRRRQLAALRLERHLRLALEDLLLARRVDDPDLRVVARAAVAGPAPELDGDLVRAAIEVRA